MDTTLEETRLLEATLEGLIAAALSPQTCWEDLGRAGFLGLALHDGSVGVDMGLQMLVARVLGRHGLPLPHLSSEVLCVPFLAGSADLPAVRALAQPVADGRARLALAVDDVQETCLSTGASGLRLGGVKALVFGAADATHFVVSTRLDGDPAIVLTNAAAGTVIPYRDSPAEAAADVVFAGVDGVEVVLLCRGAEVGRRLADARARGLLATCAAMVGAMEALLALSVLHLRTRRQFDQPLAGFQVLRHRAADMYVELETARSMLDIGPSALDAPLAQRQPALDALKLKVNSAARFVGESAVQLHGGVGMAMEGLPGRLFARLTAQQIAFGDSRACLQRLVSTG